MKTHDQTQQGKIQTFSVVMTSRQYGEETFRGYESLGEAYKALARIATSCAEYKDGVHRTFNVVMETHFSPQPDIEGEVQSWSNLSQSEREEMFNP